MVRLRWVSIAPNQTPLFFAMHGSITVLILGWISVVRMVMGGRGGLGVVVAVSPDTTEGAPPADADIDCTGATVPALIVLAGAAEWARPAPAGYHAAGKEERTIGSMSRTWVTTL